MMDNSGGMKYDVKYDVICVGQAVVDCITRGREAEACGKDPIRWRRSACQPEGML